MKSIGPWPAAGLALSLTLMPAGSTLASPERLEADLRAMFGDTGMLEIGDVSSPTFSLGSRVVAEALVYESDQGERVLIDRYTVRGDYDAPDAVVIDGLSVEDSQTGLTLISAKKLLLEEPSHAVFPMDGSSSDVEWHIQELAIDDLTFDLASELAEGLFGDAPWAGGSGHLDIARIEGRDLAKGHIGLFEAKDLSGEGRNLGELGSGSFRLALFRMENVRDLDVEGETRGDELLLSDMVFDTDRLTGAFERLRLDGNMDDGQGGLWLDALSMDLDRMIAQAPADQRTQMRMVSNVLTDGTGELNLDAAFEGRWTADDGKGTLLAKGMIDVADALRVGMDMDLPVAVPEGADASTYLANSDNFEDLTLLGGNIVLRLEDLGMFGRIAPIGAAMSGVSEQQYLEQARTQAKGFGMMLGKEAQEILVALVGMLEGDVSKLTVSTTLPAESSLATYREDPLGVTERAKIRVESR
ncbi:hypothetical protein GCM10007160_13060 [Litchfieldella qijiaojingensis]|uniref:DUF2125 domain-containing protein n=1 Tax=Litchfieldella qijiaojingensis TaxID=980347 RepID=A0ABQ2YLT0_9GAMM|nr:hypothetical protein [Halomonas qijiaojingensis]GGX87109.1 hypothetical protein GCM10007160_13060 [Halomonas qijiaojingensis]